jgi:hypothetical protein
MASKENFTVGDKFQSLFERFRRNDFQGRASYPGSLYEPLLQV